MKLDFRKRIVLYLVLLMAVMLLLTGILLMTETFAGYNQLSLDRQDDHLKKMAHAIDDSMTWQLNNVQSDLEYAVGRRAFAEAEKQWLEQSSTERLEYRMEECLVNGNPLLSPCWLCMKTRSSFPRTAEKITAFCPEWRNIWCSAATAREKSIWRF